MKAAQYTAPGDPLKVCEIAEPHLLAGAVILGKLHTFVSPSWQGIMASGPASLPPAPFTPGMSVVGVVEEMADDVRGLALGQKVYCDSYVSSQNISAPADSGIIGYLGLAPADDRPGGFDHFAIDTTH